MILIQFWQLTFSQSISSSYEEYEKKKFEDTQWQGGQKFKKNSISLSIVL